ncbi:MAG: hypothetical protein IT495_21675 [Gammaproteobacteria bacterium]|nr:hypothetical protein [Gammaproteobacteria bacterium]
MPWTEGKHTLCKAYMQFLAHWARTLSWKETAQSFHTSWEKVFQAYTRSFFAQVLDQARAAAVLSDEHFSVDGTLVEVRASMKSFRPKDGSGNPPGPGRNGERDFRGEQRENDTHASTTDPDARLYRKAKGQASQLCYHSQVPMENHHALIVDHQPTHATGTAELETAVTMAERLPGTHRVTVGADKNYDTTRVRG